MCECKNKGALWSNKRIDEDVLPWFGHVERMENDRTAKRVYVGKSAGRKQKRWTGTVEECFRLEKLKSVMSSKHVE